MMIIPSASPKPQRSLVGFCLSLGYLLPVRHSLLSQPRNLARRSCSLSLVDLLVGRLFSRVGLISDCLTCSCLQSTQERAYCVFTHFKDGSLFVTLNVLVFECKVMTFTFRKQKEKTAHSGHSCQCNCLSNPQASVLPVADRGYLRIGRLKSPAGKFVLSAALPRS
jgi:hypothetical protein